MPRTDYEKFLSSFSGTNERPFSVLHMGSDELYSYPFAKCVDTRTVLIEDVDDAELMGVNIDVFPIDNMSDSYPKAKSLFRSVERTRRWLTLKRVKVREERSWYKNLILRIGKLILRQTTARELAGVINKAAQRYAAYDLTDYVCVAVLGTYGISEIMNGECFSDWVPVEFEGRAYRAPVGWDEVLSHLYGDYMTPPPEKDRVTHHSNVAYWKA